MIDSNILLNDTHDLQETDNIQLEQTFTMFLGYFTLILYKTKGLQNFKNNVDQCVKKRVCKTWKIMLINLKILMKPTAVQFTNNL